MGTQKNTLNETVLLSQGSHRLEKYFDCLEKSMEIKFALKST